MLIKIFHKSILYAGSSLLFSGGRQLLFFPLLYRLSPQLFADVSFFIVLFDSIIYVLGASVADYYVKKVTKDDNKLALYKYLQQFTLISLLTFFIFYFYNINITVSFILSFYILMYALNTLQMKLFFNNLKFSENYLYICLRLSPYFVFLAYQSYSNSLSNSILIFALLLFFFEFFAYIILKKKLIEVYSNIYDLKAKIDLNIFKFIFVYFLFALIFRLDFFIIKYFYSDSYNEYYQMISVLMFFVSPIVLLTSASLLSILTHFDITSFLKYKKPIFFVIVIISIALGALFQILGPYITSFLYPDNTLIVKHSLLSFLIVSSTIIFHTTKTFIIKYNTTNSILLSNILLIIVPLLFYDKMNLFIITFFSIRATIYSIQYYSIGETNER